ncbi:MAG: NAD(P)H-dependent oxidoreductase [Deltaproteobacteria bacterium]|nr:NAD(P)H-dependent oxidoreductase [Deltaproteobacteria bacterium]
MAAKPRILAFAGSARKDSLNKKLVRNAAAAATRAGADVTLVDLRDFPLPVYDGDLEEASGLPEHAKRLKKLFLEHDALLISSPEYNSSIPGPLKNVLDWVSREETDDEKPLACYRGKLCTLVSASPGALGGLRALVALRMMLGNIGVTVLPDQLAVGKAHEAFTDDGVLKDAKQLATLERVVGALVTDTAKLRG